MVMALYRALLLTFSVEHIIHLAGDFTCIEVDLGSISPINYFLFLTVTIRCWKDVAIFCRRMTQGCV